MSLKDHWPPGCSLRGPTESPAEEDSGGWKRREGVEEGSTLLWSGDRQTGGQVQQQDVGETGDRSDCEEASRTESQRELMVGGEKRRPGQEEAGLMRKNLQEEEELMKRHLEEEGENFLPQKASQVFSPAVSVLHSTSLPRRDSEAFWEMESDKSPFLDHQETTQDHQHFQHGYQPEWDEDTPNQRCKQLLFSLVSFFLLPVHVSVLLLQVDVAVLRGMS